MNPLTTRNRSGPEAILQDAFVKRLRSLEWFVMETHGNAFQQGFPDVYATHHRHGIRWIEMKILPGYSFTAAQQRCFPMLSANGTCIWIVTADTMEEYEKLFQPHNWERYFLARGFKS
jgi:hypothetical protein